MKHRVAMLSAALLFGITLLGCEPPTPVSSGPPPPPGSTPPPPPPAAPATTAAPVPPETKFGVFAGDVNDLAARPSAPQPAQQSSLPPAEPGMERVKAQAGVGAKGRSLDNEQGLLVTPVKAFFAAK